MSTYGPMFREGPDKREYDDVERHIAHAEKFKQDMIDFLVPRIDDETVTLTNFDFLGVLYEEEQVTAGGIIKPPSVTDASKSTAKGFLIIKMGDLCFNEEKAARNIEDVFPKGKSPKLYDWVACQPYKGWPITVAGIECKVFYDRDVKMKIKYPKIVF